VRIDEKLQKLVKSEAPKRDVNLEAAYDQALRRWLADGGLRRNEPYKSDNHDGEHQSGIGNTKIGGYNSLHAVETARRAAQSLREIAADLDALENDVHTASSDEPAVSDEEREQARYAALSERATELLQSARTAHEQHRRNEADIERNKRRNDRKTSGGAA